MKFEITPEDLVTFRDTGEWAEEGWQSGPVVVISVLGVEVERKMLPLWGTEDSDNDIGPCVERVERMIKTLWDSAGEKT